MDDTIGNEWTTDKEDNLRINVIKESCLSSEINTQTGQVVECESLEELNVIENNGTRMKVQHYQSSFSPDPSALFEADICSIDQETNRKYYINKLYQPLSSSTSNNNNNNNNNINNITNNQIGNNNNNNISNTIMNNSNNSPDCDSSNVLFDDDLLLCQELRFLESTAQLNSILMEVERGEVGEIGKILEDDDEDLINECNEHNHNHDHNEPFHLSTIVDVFDDSSLTDLVKLTSEHEDPLIVSESSEQNSVCNYQQQLELQDRRSSTLSCMNGNQIEKEEEEDRISNSMSDFNQTNIGKSTMSCVNPDHETLLIPTTTTTTTTSSSSSSSSMNLMESQIRISADKQIAFDEIQTTTSAIKRNNNSQKSNNKKRKTNISSDKEDKVSSSSIMNNYNDNDNDYEYDNDNNDNDDDDDIEQVVLSCSKKQSRARSRTSSEFDEEESDSPMVKRYRRRTANARERIRMREINRAFEKLKKVVPIELIEKSSNTTSTSKSSETSNSNNNKSQEQVRRKNVQDSLNMNGGEFDDDANQQNEPVKLTKITTLRLAVSYISRLSQLLNENSNGQPVSLTLNRSRSPEGIAQSNGEDSVSKNLETRKRRTKKRKSKSQVERLSSHSDSFESSRLTSNSNSNSNSGAAATNLDCKIISDQSTIREKQLVAVQLLQNTQTSNGQQNSQQTQQPVTLISTNNIQISQSGLCPIVRCVPTTVGQPNNNHLVRPTQFAYQQNHNNNNNHHHHQQSQALSISSAQANQNNIEQSNSQPHGAFVTPVAVAILGTIQTNSNGQSQIRAHNIQGPQIQAVNGNQVYNIIAAPNVSQGAQAQPVTLTIDDLAGMSVLRLAQAPIGGLQQQATASIRVPTAQNVFGSSGGGCGGQQQQIQSQFVAQIGPNQYNDNSRCQQSTYQQQAPTYQSSPSAHRSQVMIQTRGDIQHPIQLIGRDTNGTMFIGPREITRYVQESMNGIEQNSIIESIDQSNGKAISLQTNHELNNYQSNNIQNHQSTRTNLIYIQSANSGTMMRNANDNQAHVISSPNLVLDETKRDNMSSTTTTTTSDNVPIQYEQVKFVSLFQGNRQQQQRQQQQQQHKIEVISESSIKQLVASLTTDINQSELVDDNIMASKMSRNEQSQSNQKNLSQQQQQQQVPNQKRTYRFHNYDGNMMINNHIYHQNSTNSNRSSSTVNHKQRVQCSNHIQEESVQRKSHLENARETTNGIKKSNSNNNMGTSQRSRQNSLSSNCSTTSSSSSFGLNSPTSSNGSTNSSQTSSPMINHSTIIPNGCYILDDDKSSAQGDSLRNHCENQVLISK